MEPSDRTPKPRSKDRAAKPEVSAVAVDDSRTPVFLTDQLLWSCSKPTDPSGAPFETGRLPAIVASILCLAGFVIAVLLSRVGPVWAHAAVAVVTGAAAVTAFLAARVLLREADNSDAAHRAVLRHADTIFSAVADGVAIVGPDERVLACNRAGAQILGSRPEDLVGQALDSPGIWYLHDDGTPLSPDDH